MPSFTKKALTSFVLRFGALGLQFAGSVMIARVLGVDGFGVYSIAFTWTMLLGTVIGLGLGPLAVRELPKYMVRGDHGAVLGYIVMWAGSVLITAVIVAALLAGLETYGLVDLGVGWRWVALAAFVQALVLGLSTQLNGFQQILRAQMLETILRQSLYLGILALFVFLGLSLDPSRVFSLSILAALPVVGLMGVLLWRTLTNELPHPRAPMTFRPALWFAASLPLLASTFATQMQTNLDVLMLGVLADDAAVGRYRAASRGADLALIANGLAVQVLGPMLSKALAQDKKALAQSLISQSAAVSGGLGVLICGALILFPTLYLGLFGADFQAAAPALQILAAAQAVSLLSGPVAMILVMLGREKMVLMVSLSSLALNFTLNFLLIPIWGIEGAAIATFIAVVMVKLTLLVVVLRVSGFDPTVWSPVRLRLARGWAKLRAKIRGRR
jgi:O-antigen/teichoic acid export membrane protein